MSFDENFQRLKRPIWQEQYINIYKLRSLISLDSFLNQDTYSEFFIQLGTQIDKFLNFYISLQIKVSLKQSKVRKKARDTRVSRLQDIHVFIESLTRLASFAMQSCLFLNVNLQATRVVLKQYENHLIKKQKHGREAIYQQLAKDRIRVDQLFQREVFDKIHSRLQKTHLPRAEKMTEKFSEDVFLTAGQVNEKLKILRLTFKDFEDQLHELKGTSPFSLYFYHQVGTDTRIGIIQDASVPTSNLILTLILVFMYMSNEYMLTVTASSFLLHIGISLKYVGFLNALSPFTGLIFSTLTGISTKYSYKIPLALSSISIMFGNAFIAFSVHTKLGILLFIGKMCIGIGGSGLISRKYMAHHVSIANRARWSFALITVSSLGMAFGPLIPLFFNNFNLNFYIEISALNAPSIVWICLFLLYIIALLCIFTDTEIQETPDQGSPNSNFSYVAVLFCLWVVMIASGIQQAFIMSSPIVTYQYFGWTLVEFGWVIAALCLIQVPSHYFIGLLSFKLENIGMLTVGSLIFVLGSIGLAVFGENLATFLVVSVLIFFSSDINQGVANSLMSRKMPPKLYRIFRSTGFVSAQAVLFGNTMAGIFVSVMIMTERENLMEVLAIAWSVIGGMSLVLMFLSRKRLRREVYKW